MGFAQKLRSVLVLGPCSAVTSAANEVLVVFLTASIHMQRFIPTASFQVFTDSQFASSSHRDNMVGDNQSIVNPTARI